jgi:hypothetical protein
MWARSRYGNKPQRPKNKEKNYSYWWPEEEAITIKERKGKGMRHLKPCPAWTAQAFLIF